MFLQKGVFGLPWDTPDGLFGHDPPAVELVREKVLPRRSSC